jgi:hypothetical protein
LGLRNEIVGKLSSGTEVINGTGQDDYIRPLGGSDYIDGKKGFDTVFVYWPSSKFKLTTIQGTTYLDAVSGASRSDKLVLRNVEAIEFSDIVVSLEIADRFTNTTSNDNFDGGPGIDTVVYDKPISNYVATAREGGINVSPANDPNGSGDWLQNIERLQFSDKGLAFDVEGRAGVAAKTLGLVFGVAAVQVPAFVGICLDFLDNKKYTAEQLMHAALVFPLGSEASDPQKVVPFLYERLTGGPPSPSEKDKYVSWITSGMYTADGLAVFASELGLNPVTAQLTGLATTGLAFQMPA